MDTKTALIVLIRDFTLQIVKSLLSLIRVAVMSKFFLPNRKPVNSKKELYILGNGPSLNKFLNEHQERLSSCSKIAVNYFARTKEYQVIQPDFYVIISPEYFRVEEKKDWADDRELTLQLIKDTTKWEMTLMLPAIAKGHPLVKKYFNRHPHISIYYINNTPVDGFRRLTHLLYSHNFGIPRPHNVLIPAIWFGIKFGFKSIYITGSDHSWLKDLSVSPQNEVLLTQKHFYDKQAEKEKTDKNKATPQAMYKGTSKNKRKLHEVLHKFMVSFESYWDLKSYAESKNVEIINLTLDSYIDAFEKRELSK